MEVRHTEQVQSKIFNVLKDIASTLKHIEENTCYDKQEKIIQADASCAIIGKKYDSITKDELIINGKELVSAIKLRKNKDGYLFNHF